MYFLDNQTPKFLIHKPRKFLHTHFTIQLIFVTIHESHCIFFGTIYGSHYTILANFYLYLQYFQQKNFSFNKISQSQIDH